MASRSFIVFLCIGIALVLGCSRASPPPDPDASRGDSKLVVTESVLMADQRALLSSSAHLESVTAELQQLATAAPWRKSGFFFDAEQQDQIENLLFRFLACRNTLWQLANDPRDHERRYASGEAQAKSSVIAFNAGFLLILHDASLVSAFRGDAVAIAKLNEEFYRSRIPAETYDRLLLGVTNEDQLRFTLVERAGHPTLSADDIANNYLASPGKTFEFVLFADESPESVEHQARILTGKAGITQLTELMATQQD